MLEKGCIFCFEGIEAVWLVPIIKRMHLLLP